MRGAARSCRGVLALLVLGSSTAAQQPHPHPSSVEEQRVDSEWMPVPVRVVPEVRVGNGSWTSRSRQLAGHSWFRDEELGPLGPVLRVQHRALDDGLEIDAGASDGYVAESFSLHLQPGPAGSVVARASGHFHCCVGSGDFEDLHGEVLLEAREAASSEPLRFRFRIDALYDGRPMRSEGEVELALERGGTPTFGWCAPGEPATDAEREVWWRWADGTPRAHGKIDGLGRRQGPWETWRPDGAFQSVTEFVDGERHGVWCFAEEHWMVQGRVEHGRREGEWFETYWNDDESETYRFTFRNDDQRSTESLGRRPRR